MKKSPILLLMLLIFAGCGKDETTPTGEKTDTSLELTVTDSRGYPASGATVKLFSTESDWLEKTNEAAPMQVADEHGKVKFKNLQEINYYWFAQKDCETSRHSSYTTSNPLTKDRNTTSTCELKKIGVMKLVNNSSNPYYVYINGEFFTEMAGKKTSTYSQTVAGYYSVKVVQKSGYVFEPTVVTFDATISCGKTTTLSFP